MEIPCGAVQFSWKEFYRHYFQQDTIHSEAMGISRIYEKYAPDMMVDNHGVPSHEWEQQFSGYTSRPTKVSGFRDRSYMVISGM